MCFGRELMPESMPGWPISKKHRKDLVPSTNDGRESSDGDFFFCLIAPSPSTLPLFLSHSVGQLGVHSKTLSEYLMRRAQKQSDFQTCACVRTMCVCVCPLFVEQNCPHVSLDRHRAVQQATEDYKPSLCLFTLAHSALLLLANEVAQSHIHSLRWTHPKTSLKIGHFNIVMQG